MNKKSFIKAIIIAGIVVILATALIIGTLFLLKNRNTKEVITYKYNED